MKLCVKSFLRKNYTACKKKVFGKNYVEKRITMFPNLKKIWNFKKKPVTDKGIEVRNKLMSQRHKNILFIKNFLRGMV